MNQPSPETAVRRAVHRLRGLEDSVLFEASTAPECWREDVVRLEDRYGRLGTTAS